MLENQINNLQIKSVKIKDIELLPQAIGELNIYESLTAPAITGNITIADWQGFDEIGDIFAGDTITIAFTTQGEADLLLPFTIYGASTSVQFGHTFQPMTYTFCSSWLVDGLTRQISKAYKDKYIHDIISDLLTECGATIGYIEPTIQKLNHFTTPLWTAVHSIHHLLSFAMNKQEVGGYVIWTDLQTNKVNVTTVDYLASGKFGKQKDKFMSLPENELYENRIRDLSFDSSFDIIKYLNNGTAQTLYQTFYHDKNKMFTFDKSVDQVTQFHLAKNLPINNKFNTKKYSTLKTSYSFPNNDGLVSDENELKYMIDGKAKTKYVRLTADIIKLNILTNPNSSRRVGHVCDLEYQSTDKTKVQMNTQYSGKYLIRNIRHMIFNGAYSQALTLMTDGYQNTKNQLVTWR